ncbi:uncharacterized protein AKAW2_21414A [Aspergillus luchuensis]|uniref:Uncharacterized protein n=1 Tax=Aspergillus kawachii TaxID=1069201 RepID=A0A7R7W5M2_ASPKA|nr:uncharacterized protein AKAW2_21414A [Aspergillus luchuensis]BCR96474.1 hypothetical protein AKAW2_21414A [Aspergillus luchuensis]
MRWEVTKKKLAVRAVPLQAGRLDEAGLAFSPLQTAPVHVLPAPHHPSTAITVLPSHFPFPSLPFPSLPSLPHSPSLILNIIHSSLLATHSSLPQPSQVRQ